MKTKKNQRNCPNCGAPIEPYKHKCSYCGTYYFDFTAFNMEEGVPCFIKFKTPMGVITTLAKPEMNEIETIRDENFIVGSSGVALGKFTTSISLDFHVIFHALLGERGDLAQIETKE